MPGGAQRRKRFNWPHSGKGSLRTSSNTIRTSRSVQLLFQLSSSIQTLRSIFPSCHDCLMYPCPSRYRHPHPRRSLVVLVHPSLLPQPSCPYTPYPYPPASPYSLTYPIEGNYNRKESARKFRQSVWKEKERHTSQPSPLYSSPYSTTRSNTPPHYSPPMASRSRSCNHLSLPDL